jgi:hypothetical protein
MIEMASWHRLSGLWCWWCWRTGHLLALTPRKRAGQRLSRPLNGVDGLLAQAGVLLLTNNNQALGALHLTLPRPTKGGAKCRLIRSFNFALLFRDEHL